MKKILSVLIVLAVAGTVLCGCSSNKAEKNNSNDFKISYTYDYHYSNINDSAVRAFNQLCDAVVSGESAVLFNTALLADVNRLYYTSFPLSYLVGSLSVNSDNTGLNISYIYDTETHLKLVDEFNSKINEIMTSCGYGQVNKSEYILNVYSYISSNTKYDSIYTKTYDVLINGVGSSSSISSAFEYLLAQGGIKNSHIYGMGAEELEFLSVADVNGENYIFNPGKECKETNGKGLSYFGLSYADLLDSGFDSGFTYTDEEPVAFDDTTEKFSSLRSTVSYEFKDGVITAVRENGEKITVSL